MEIDALIQKRPFLYHLTSRDNLQNIRNAKMLLSTNTIVNMSELSDDDKNTFKRTKRKGHKVLSVNGQDYSIRDQDPINMNLLPRCLNNISADEYIMLLNNRVFFWPTINRLKRHFDRYVHEEPVILKIRTEDILGLNNDVLLSRLNSGATRCHPSYGGSPPPRGSETFIPVNNWNLGVSSVAEVTVIDECQLPDHYFVGEHYHGPWVSI